VKLIQIKVMWKYYKNVDQREEERLSNGQVQFKAIGIPYMEF